MNASSTARVRILIVQRRYVDAMRDALIAERSIGADGFETYRQVESMSTSVSRRASPG